jgi:hypothetical protein
VSTEDTDQKDADQQDERDQKDQKDQQDADGKDGDEQDIERYESGQIKEMPEPTDDQKSEAQEQRKAYTDERPTTVLPGTAHTVTGTAVNDWVDDDGNPKKGEAEGDSDDEHRTLEKTDDRVNVADEDNADNQDNEDNQE